MYDNNQNSPNLILCMFSSYTAFYNTTRNFNDRYYRMDRVNGIYPYQKKILCIGIHVGGRRNTTKKTQTSEKLPIRISNVWKSVSVFFRSFKRISTGTRRITRMYCLERQIHEQRLKQNSEISESRL